MIDYSAVKIAGIDFGTVGSNDVFQCLRYLYTTPAGSVPFDREFGINTDFIDDPITIAKGKIMMEYREKTKKYEPRASVESVSFESDEMNGYLSPRVVVNFVDNT